MADKLHIISLFAGVCTMVYALSMGSVPGRGYMKVIERVCMGAMLCWVCSALLKPFGIHIAQGPFTALAAGFWGLPGVALSAFVGLGP